MGEETHEAQNHKFRLLIKRPSWGYSKEERQLMTREEYRKRILSPLHEASFYTGGMFMQIEAPGRKSETYVFRPRTKSGLMTFLSSTALKKTTLATYPGKVYVSKHPNYDEELEYDITKTQYDGIRKQLLLDSTRNLQLPFNYAVHDSGLYALRLAADHDVPVPLAPFVAPLELYEYGGRYEHRIRLHSPVMPDGEILTLFPRNAAGIEPDDKHRRIGPSFEEHLLEERMQRIRSIEGFGL